VNGSCRFLANSQPKWIGLVWGLAASCTHSLHSSNKPGELSRDFGHDDRQSSPQPEHEQSGEWACQNMVEREQVMAQSGERA